MDVFSSASSLLNEEENTRENLDIFLFSFVKDS